MKLFLLALSYVVTVAPSQTLVTQPPDSNRYQATDQLDHKSQRADENRRGSTVEVAGDSVENPYYKTYHTSDSKTAPQTGGWLKNICECGDCNCPDPMVCRAGDCKKNYVIFLTAEWCRPCQRMYPTIKELRDQDYIVYAFDVEEYPEAAKRFMVSNLPTIVIMDQGQEVKRFIGVTHKDKITGLLLTRGEQETSVKEVGEEDYKLY